jgi:molybdate transport system substrate-binding protein
MKFKNLLFTIIFALLFNGSALAQTIKVAAAANLQSVIKALQSDFKVRTGIVIEPIIGSSGKLTAQIMNGAPYDVFMSADVEYPQQLNQEGFAEYPPVVYALGVLIVCTVHEDLMLNSWAKIIDKNKFDKIAIANPTIAPYGRAAEQVLTKLKLFDKAKPDLVYGESISQVNTYITTGVVTLGFTAQSMVLDPANPTKLAWRFVDPKLYDPIEQGMVLLKRSENKEAAKRFYTYIGTAPAKKILKLYGYIVH